VDGACDERARPAGVLSWVWAGRGRVKERTAHSVKHVALVRMRVTWHKSRLWCDNPGCDTGVSLRPGRWPARLRGFRSTRRR